MNKRFHFCIKCAFILTLAITLFEFFFIQGLFTWFFTVAITFILGMVNILICMIKKQWQQALIYTILTCFVCGGYFLYALQNP